MATQNLIKTTFQFRRATTSEWEQYKDVVPAAGEPCFDIELGTLKIGNGVKSYGELDVIGGGTVAPDGTSIIVNDGVFKIAGFDAAETGAYPVKKSDGTIEWIVPSTQAVDDLQVVVNELKLSVTEMQQVVYPEGDNSKSVLDRVADVEAQVNTLNGSGEGSVKKTVDEAINEFASKVSDDETVNTFKELVDYVVNHGGEVNTIVADIMDLQYRVGDEPVRDQIAHAIGNSNHISKDEANSTLLSKVEAEAVLNHVKYEITSKPVGTLIDYRDKEIRVMCPADTKWEKQSVGASGNANMYYMGFKAYAPNGAVSFKEGDRGVIIDEMFDFNGAFAGTDEYGRNYSICWLALASYDEATGTWNYFGKNSTAKKYIGWNYVVEWYDANGVKIDSDSIRINLSNEACHNTIEPYYMANIVKEVAVNGTLLDVVDGRVDITIENTINIKGSDEIEVAEDGTVSIKSISFDKIVQSEGAVLVMDGGGAV